MLPTIRSRCVLIKHETVLNAETGLAAGVLHRLQKGEDGMAVAASFPKDRTELTDFFAQVSDAAHAQLRGADGGIYARIIPLADKALMMTRSNLNTELCAQWFCLKTKEEWAHGNSRRR